MSAMDAAAWPWKKATFASRLQFVEDYPTLRLSGSDLPLFF
jgi:hypothetical protein